MQSEAENMIFRVKWGYLREKPSVLVRRPNYRQIKSGGQTKFSKPSDLPGGQISQIWPRNRQSDNPGHRKR